MNVLGGSRGEGAQGPDTPLLEKSPVAMCFLGNTGIRPPLESNVVRATIKGSDQPAHTRSLVRAFASRIECSMSVKILFEQYLEFVSLKGGCTDSSESTLVKMQHCWKSHVAAQIEYTVE